MVFLGVAAFLLHVLLSRIVGTQREQIATLKALGYRTRELTWHYLEFALAISVLGADSLDEVLRLQFEVSRREDITVTLDEARPWRAVRDAAHFPGARRAEGERLVPVRLRAAYRWRTAAILGVDSGGDIHRLLGPDLRPFRLPRGLSLSRTLGEELDMVPADVRIVHAMAIPFLQSRGSPFVTVTSVVTAAIGISLPVSFFGPIPGITTLPAPYWPLMAVTLLCYMLLTQAVKMLLLRRAWI